MDGGVVEVNSGSWLFTIFGDPMIQIRRDKCRLSDEWLYLEVNKCRLHLRSEVLK